MSDTRIGQQSANVTLDKSDRRTDEHREGRDSGDHRKPTVVELGDCCEQNPGHRQEPGDLGHRCHIPDHTGWGTLIHVGSPAVKRRCGHLEAEPDDDQSESYQDHGRPGDYELREELSYRKYLELTGSRVQKGHSVYEDCRRKGSKQEVLHRSLVGLGLLLGQSGKDIERDRADL